MNKEKTTLEQKESHESLMSNFEENVLRFYGNIVKENLICNEFGRAIAKYLIDMKQDVAIWRAYIFFEHAGKQFFENNKQQLLRIHKYGKDSQLPSRDKFRSQDLVDLVECKWNTDLGQDDSVDLVVKEELVRKI